MVSGMYSGFVLIRPPQINTLHTRTSKQTEPMLKICLWNSHLSGFIITIYHLQSLHAETKIHKAHKSICVISAMLLINVNTTDRNNTFFFAVLWCSFTACSLFSFCRVPAVPLSTYCIIYFHYASVSTAYNQHLIIFSAFFVWALFGLQNVGDFISFSTHCRTFRFGAFISHIKVIQ